MSVELMGFSMYLAWVESFYNYLTCAVHVSLDICKIFLLAASAYSSKINYFFLVACPEA